MKISISARLNADLLESLDSWVEAQQPSPSRNATIELAILEFLDKHYPDATNNRPQGQHRRET